MPSGARLGNTIHAPRRPGRPHVTGDPAAAAAALNRAPRRVRRGRPADAALPPRPNDPRFARALRAQQHRPDRRHRRRRHRRARGLGRRRARRLPVDRRRRRSGSSTPASTPDPRGPGRQDRRLRAVAAACRSSPARSRRRCADDNGHGTHVAGTITANANNGRASTGVAFNSPLSICKALGGPLGQGTTADVANCITWVHRPGREGDLDEPRRRRVDDAAERGHRYAGGARTAR